MIQPITTGGVSGWEMALGGMGGMGGVSGAGAAGAAKGAVGAAGAKGAVGATGATGAAGAAGGVSDAAGAGNAGENSGAGGTATSDGSGGIQMKNRFDRNECQTCKNRRYQDESNDPGVSMKAPTALSPAAAGAAVASHEQEHVTRNKAQAESEGREVISSSVQIHSAICPECGKTYVAGGTTRTVTANKKDNSQNQNQDQPAANIQ